MKKYLILGTVLVLLGVLGAKVWYAKSACGNKFVPGELSEWLVNSDMNIFEVGDKSFYVQEAIGSQGIEMLYPRLLKGDFLLTFNLMSLTAEANIRICFLKENDEYETEMKFSSGANKLKFYRNKMLLLEKDVAQIEPDIFYNFQLQRKGNVMSFEVDKEEFLKMETSDLPVKIRLSVSGHPDNPAAVEIMDWEVQN